MIIHGGQEDKIYKITLSVEFAVSKLIWFKENFDLENGISAWIYCKR